MIFFLTDCNIELHVSSDQICEHKAKLKKFKKKSPDYKYSSWNKMD